MRSVISHIPLLWTDDEAKHELIYEIDRFIEERIQVADDAIVGLLLDGKKIIDGDVILTCVLLPALPLTTQAAACA